MRAVAPLLVLFAGCPAERTFQSYDLRRTPFENAWVARGAATLEVAPLDGYDCPDGRTARVYVLRPAEYAADAPLALLLHGGNLDVADRLQPQSPAAERLTASWSARAVETLLGMESALGSQNQGEGAWAGALLARGFVVAAPAGCWGDLWHGRGGNDISDGFLRLGGHALSDTVATLRAEATGPLVVVGLGEGGRASAELLRDEVTADGIIVDATPDWLPAALAQSFVYEELIAGLERSWSDDLAGLIDPDQRAAALRAALERDSLIAAVRDHGLRVPTAVLWSATDEVWPAEFTRPLADTVSALLPPDDQRIVEWGSTVHAPSNRSLDEAGATLDWLLARIAASR
jgi:hypothetical protein